METQSSVDEESHKETTQSRSTKRTTTSFSTSNSTERVTTASTTKQSELRVDGTPALQGDLINFLTKKNTYDFFNYFFKVFFILN